VQLASCTLCRIRSPISPFISPFSSPISPFISPFSSPFSSPISPFSGPVSMLVLLCPLNKIVQDPVSVALSLRQ